MKNEFNNNNNNGRSIFNSVGNTNYTINNKRKTNGEKKWQKQIIVEISLKEKFFHY